MTRRIAERELLRSRRRRRRVSRSGLLGLLGLLRGLLRRLALLSGLLPSGIGGGGLRLLGGEGAEGDENNSGKSSGDRADHRETPEACAGRIPGAIGRTTSTTSRVASPAPPNSSGRAWTAPATGSPSARGRRTTRSCRASAGPRKGWRAAAPGRTSDSRFSGDRLSPRTRCTTFTPQSGRADCTGWSTYRRAGSMFRL